jgi:hypothetical protein
MHRLEGATAGCDARSSTVADPHRLSALTCAAVATAFATGAPISSQTPARTKNHQTYTRVVLGPLPLQKIYHPGEALRFLWCPLPGPLTTDAQPILQTLSAHLIGPYGP